MSIGFSLFVLGQLLITVVQGVLGFIIVYSVLCGLGIGMNVIILINSAACANNNQLKLTYFIAIITSLCGLEMLPQTQRTHY